jgi:hypothetical protein
VRSGLIDVGSAEALCACERLVCVEKVDVRIVFFFCEVFVGKSGALKQLWGAAGSFVLKFSKG